MQSENMYEIDGNLYTIQFPREWAENHEPETGPKECENCEYFGKWNGVFIGYCANCAQNIYKGKRGKGFISIGEELNEFDTKGVSAWQTYLKNIEPNDIGDKNIENSYLIIYENEHPIHEEN